MNKRYKLYSENGEANENDQSIRSDLCPFPQLKSRFQYRSRQISLLSNNTYPLILNNPVESKDSIHAIPVEKRGGDVCHSG